MSGENFFNERMRDTFATSWSYTEEFIVVELLRLCIRTEIDYDFHLISEYYDQVISFAVNASITKKLRIKTIDQIKRKIISIKNYYDVFQKLLTEQLKLNFAKYF